MVHAPYHLAYVVVVECAFVKVPWSIIIQGGWFSVSAGVQFRLMNVWTACIQSLQIYWSLIDLFQRLNHFNRWNSSAEHTRSHFALLPCVIKSLLALPRVGVSVSCRHAVSHFEPVMTILGAGLTPVVIRLPAVYPLTPLRSKISLCSVSVWEERKKTLFYRALGVDVGLYSSYGFRDVKQYHFLT